MNLLCQRVTYTNCNAPLYLQSYSLRVDHKPHILGAYDSLDLNLASSPVDFNFCHMCYIASRVHCAGHTITSTAWGL